jgi:hydrogenase-4 component E
MNVNLPQWLPRSSAINLLAGVFLLSALYVVSQRRTAACISGYAWNSVSLGLIAALVAATTDARHIWIAALLVLAVKGVLIPRVLAGTLAQLKTRDEAEPYVSIPVSMLICGGLVVLGVSETRTLFGASPTVLGSCLPISVATALIGLFLMVSRRQALLMVVGLVIVENAIFLAAVSLTYGMPLVVEMGVLLDVLVAVALLGMFVGRIEEAFESADRAGATRDRT